MCRESVLRVAIAARPARCDAISGAVTSRCLPGQSCGRVHSMHGRLHNGRCVVLRRERGRTPGEQNFGERPSEDRLAWKREPKERRTKSEDVSPWLLLVQDGLAKSHCSQVTSKTDYCGFKLWCAANVLGSSDKTCHARARGGQSWKPSVVIVRRARDVVRGGDGPDGGCGDSVRGRQWGRGLDSCGFDTGRGMAGLEMG